MARRKTPESTHAPGRERENNGTPSDIGGHIDSEVLRSALVSAGCVLDFGLPGGLHHPMTMTIDAEGLAWHDQVITRAHLLAEQRAHVTVYRT